MGMPIPLFIDLDGTLVDSEPLHWAAWCETLRPSGIQFAWEEYEATAIGRTDAEILTSLIARGAHDLRTSNLQGILRAKRSRFASIVLRTPAVAAETIDILRSITHWKLALVTSSTRMEAAALPGAR
jgi:beta-phosphoglucomutase-like phosphatase (HAD superfamily)